VRIVGHPFLVVEGCSEFATARIFGNQSHTASSTECEIVHHGLSASLHQ
jgi:hypothetical protein